MKKIKHIKDIEREKLRLRVQQLEQERKLKENWVALKEDLKPGNILRSKIAEFTHEKSGDKGLVSGLVNAGAAYLSKRLTGYAGEKIDSTIQAGIDKASERLKAFLSRKRTRKQGSQDAR